MWILVSYMDLPNSSKCPLLWFVCNIIKVAIEYCLIKTSNPFILWVDNRAFISWEGPDYSIGLRGSWVDGSGVVAHNERCTIVATEARIIGGICETVESWYSISMPCHWAAAADCTVLLRNVASGTGTGLGLTRIVPGHVASPFSSLLNKHNLRNLDKRTCSFSRTPMSNYFFYCYYVSFL